jgi:DNA (cytosine-5)-methyltransferase 1
MKDPLFLVIDLFCGAGGTTCGFVQAELDGNAIVKVIACVNHDPIAIKSHWANHPEVKHFEEDIRTLDLTELVKLVDFYRTKYPNAKVILWASLECTNFSKAKGGLPRDADSRTLADHLDRYIVALNCDYVKIENVVEFMSWGPLDENGKPVSKKNGQDWMRWRKLICGHGYVDEWTELNSANYGAYTSRNRLFGIFARPWLPICFPQPTHAKKPSSFSMYGDLKKWMPVKEVLDFKDEGQSIFTRDKALSDKTLERIYAGLIKYVAKGDKAFIAKYFSGKPDGKVIPVDGPAGTIATAGNQSLVQAEFLVKYNSRDKAGNYNPPSVDDPSPVISTQNRLYLAQAKFLTHYYGTGGQLSSIESPAPTIPTKARTALVSPEFLTIYNGKSLNRGVDEPAPVVPCNDRLGLVQPQFFIDKQHNSGDHNHQSVEQPAGAILPYPKMNLVQCDPFIMPTNFDNKPVSVDQPAPTITANRKHHYLVNPSWYGNPGSVEEPCCVIVARQDKAPLYFVQVESGRVAIEVYEGDSDIMIKIKQFMAVYELVDIKMRMLRVHELLSIQGFPAGYKLEGNQTDQKKFIGNSVVPLVVKKWIESLAMKIIDYKTNVA